MNKSLIVILLTMVSISLYGQKSKNKKLVVDYDQKVLSVEKQVIEWRHHFHQFPELSNREYKTAAKIAQICREMGLQVDTGIAHTGVVAVLTGNKPGKTVGLRADIDGLPVIERVDLPFKSIETSEYNKQKVGVMHACGHDTHIAMMLGAAKVLSEMKDQIAGKVVFVFQPAEEGPPAGEKGGAKLMVDQGLIEKYGIEAMFGQHISSSFDLGSINYTIGPAMAGADSYVIKITGKGGHGSKPWAAIDPIVTGSQIVLALQTIVSRNIDITYLPAVVTVGRFTSGNRNNIIPETAEIEGTIRTFDTDMLAYIKQRIEEISTNIAKSAGAQVEIYYLKNTPMVTNDPTISKKMLPSLYKAFGEDNVRTMIPSTGAEDFAIYGQKVPAMFYSIGARCPKFPTKVDAPSHHTSDFELDESAFKVGVKAMTVLALDYLSMD